MQFNPIHSFLKQIVRHTKNFRSITLSLAIKHQLIVGYNMLIPDSEKSSLEIAQVSKVPTDALNENVVHILSQKYPKVTTVNPAHSVTINRINHDY